MAELEIPTGIPLVYEFNKKMEKKGHYYLAEPEKLERQMSKVKKQVKKE